MPVDDAGYQFAMRIYEEGRANSLDKEAWEIYERLQCMRSTRDMLLDILERERKQHDEDLRKLRASVEYWKGKVFGADPGREV